MAEVHASQKPSLFFGEMPAPQATLRETGDSLEVDLPEPYRSRCLDVLRHHPEVRRLFGRNPATALLIAAAVFLQLILACLLREAPWWLILAAGGGIGAFINHALVGLYHECAHNLVFKNRANNHFLGIFANLPLVIPSYASFCGYHLNHHQYKEHHHLDASMATRREPRQTGHASLGKALWQLLFPLEDHKIAFFNRWVLLNAALQLSFLALFYWQWGPRAFLYLVVSFFFGVGLHPLGARWVLEHFVAIDNHQTYSYYGPMNRLAVNMGYHNEHHDFPWVPWNRLPSIKAMAPEVYGSLQSYGSWLRVWGLAAADWCRVGVLLYEALTAAPGRKDRTESAPLLRKLPLIRRRGNRA